ncbi:12995_t:CDS:2, partial [Dentiscutata heterogama]
HDTSLVYTATWKCGPYIEWDAEQQMLKRDGKGTYILKSMNNFEEEWLKENLTIEKYSQSLIRCYGFTRDPTTQSYMLVLQHMDSNLRDFLTKKPDLPWKIKFKIVRNISNGIRKLHKVSNSAHKNLHPRNILVDEAKFHCVISDFEFDSLRKSSNSIYKNILYTAPEVLCNKPYTIKSDIYSLGMIMWELTSGKPAFNDEITKSDDEFASDIINGLRPKVVDGTPHNYATLMVKCWDAIPENRPDANIVMKEMESLLRNIYENDDSSRVLKPIPLKINSKTPVKNFIKYLERKFKWF